MNITILGSGVFGMAIAGVFCENGCNVKIWNKFDNGFDKLSSELDNVHFYTGISKCIDSNTLIVIAIPIEYMEDIVMILKDVYSNQSILIVSKGIDAKTGLFASQIVNKYIKAKDIGVIAGGTFAIDMKNKSIMGLTLATNSIRIKNYVSKYLKNEYLNIQYSNDLIGVQICGAIKNIMAIGYGIFDGANMPDSSRFLFLTHAIYEMRSIINDLNGNDDTIMSYAGIDDIMMTCTSSKSRNYSLGKLIGISCDKDISEYIENNTVEGMTSALGFKRLVGKNIVKYKLCYIIYNILYNNYDYKKIFDCLKK